MTVFEEFRRMTACYPVLEVQPEWVIESENMGSKEKSWYLVPELNESNWLLKYPRRPGSGEHWAEKITSEVAKILGIPCARVELARFNNRVGSVTENIVPDDQELVHGNEVLEYHVPQPDARVLNFRLSDHTLQNIWAALDNAFESDRDAVEAKGQFSHYLVLDAVVGNVDRHSENWGLLQLQGGDQLVESLSPSYDHGSSLGRELSDERREQRLANGSVGEYAERGRGGVYWSDADRYGPSALQLVRLASGEYPALLLPAIENLRQLDDVTLHHIVSKVPNDWMSELAKSFALELMSYNREQLRGVVR